MTEYHVRQQTGTPCSPFNCAAAAGAMAVAFSTAGTHRPTSDEFRQESGRSCVPGVHSPSGGLTIQAVTDTAKRAYQTDITYAVRSPGALTDLLLAGYGAVVAGDYDQLPLSHDFAPSFHGDHSTFAHGLWTDPIRGPMTHWHDPLHTVGVDIPMSVVDRFNRKPGSPTFGLSGIVRIPKEEEPPLGAFAKPGLPAPITVNAGAPYYDDAGKRLGTLNDPGKPYLLTHVSADGKRGLISGKTTKATQSRWVDLTSVRYS